MSATTRGCACPTCGRYAVKEPGGLRCIEGGHLLFLYRRVLPRDHWLSGRDWKNGERQVSLDRAFMSPGRMREHVHAMLERLEGRPKETEEAPAPA